VTGQKYYAVWRGRKRGVFASWEECEEQVKGFAGAQYKAFSTREDARRALAAPYEDFEGKSASLGKWRRAEVKPVLPSVCADAACDGSPGRLEYRCVRTETGEQILKAGPFPDGTNNVGEFLAIVDALRWLTKQRLDWPVYSDSSNAIAWIKARKCNTKLMQTRHNMLLFAKIAQAEAELRAGTLGYGDHSTGKPRVVKWNTAVWGEIPADFGRK
jgi:ribonuclease HI